MPMKLLTGNVRSRVCRAYVAADELYGQFVHDLTDAELFTYMRELMAGERPEFIEAKMRASGVPDDKVAYYMRGIFGFAATDAPGPPAET